MAFFSPDDFFLAVPFKELFPDVRKAALVLLFLVFSLVELQGLADREPRDVLLLPLVENVALDPVVVRAVFFFDVGEVVDVVPRVVLHRPVVFEGQALLQKIVFLDAADEALELPVVV